MVEKGRKERERESRKRRLAAVSPFHTKLSYYIHKWTTEWNITLASRHKHFTDMATITPETPLSDVYRLNSETTWLIILMGPTSLMVSEALMNLEWFSYTRYCMLLSSSWISEERIHHNNSPEILCTTTNAPLHSHSLSSLSPFLPLPYLSSSSPPAYTVHSASTPSEPSPYKHPA